MSLSYSLGSTLYVTRHFSPRIHGSGSIRYDFKKAGPLSLTTILSSTSQRFARDTIFKGGTRWQEEGDETKGNSFTHVHISTLRRRILISAGWIVSPRVVKLAASDGELQWKRSTYQWLSLALFTFLACPWLSTDRIYIYIYIPLTIYIYC